MSCNRIEPEQTHGKTKRRRRSIKNGQIFTVNAKEHFDRCNSIPQCITPWYIARVGLIRE